VADDDRPPSGPPLRPEEIGWLRALAAGGTVTQLAEAAAVGERDMYRLLGGPSFRVGASNRTEAIAAAERLGLLG
jgi:hypothetical protein